jgi:hypothetical protein
MLKNGRRWTKSVDKGFTPTKPNGDAHDLQRFSGSDDFERRYLGSRFQS